MRLASEQKGGPWAAIVVSALGYFVDVYDIWLFAALRKPSLEELGISGAQLKSVGEALLNWQMFGFVLGAILFGILADKRGRLTVLFSSILLYSLANLANAFVTTVPLYAACRFVAGIGLAGELGAGVALVSELVPKEVRGWATSFVATVGVFGSVVAPRVAIAINNWHTSYIIGGVMGLVLLALRIGVFESGMYDSLKSRGDVKRGDLRLLFGTAERRSRFLATMLVGSPVWFFAGLMMVFAREVQVGLGIPNPHETPFVIAIAALGLSIGDIMFGVLSQVLKSRKKAFWTALIWMTGALIAIFHFAHDRDTFYWLMFIGGLGAGYWAVFVTTAGETFGTNCRGTVATTAPSFVRGLVIPMTMVRPLLEPRLGYLGSLQLLGVLSIAAAVWALIVLPETYGRDLDFVES